ncbi:MAG: hypothetical protein DI535_04855 [Citrobacter freundii]|nr:MAG: hypothetical protein DI535_04855 [Citrobacter freundii]
MKKSSFIKYAGVLLSGMLFFQKGISQLNIPGTGYFQNQYLLNPAMSGQTAKQVRFGMGYQQSGNIKDGPQTYYLTGDYGFNERVGAGINLFYDKAGLVNTYKVMGTYSYHIPLDERHQLHFGLSAGGVQHRLNNRSISGDLDDPLLYNYNDQFMRFEADFGMAYTDGKLTVQAAAPNLVSTFRKGDKDLVNRALFFGTVSYRLNLSDDNEDWSVEPKVAYRGIKGIKSIIDAGANLTYKDIVNVFGMYHTNKSASAGVGLKVSNVVQVTALYNTQASEFKTYSGGDYAIGLLIQLD